MISKKLFYSENYVATGLLILRIGIGIAFVMHGFPKVFSGGAEHLAGPLAKAGIPGGVAAAYLAGLTEFFGGLALIAGIIFRPASILLAFTMAVALIFHLSFNDPFVKYSHALESLVLFLSLAVTGPGKYSLDYRWLCSRDEKACSNESHSHTIPVTSG